MKTLLKTFAAAALGLLAATAVADPKTAVWVGGHSDNDASVNVNWECRDESGTLIPDALPTAETDVTIPSSLAGSMKWANTFASCKSLTFDGGPVTLAADCDWRGMPLAVITAETTIRLAGHQLQISPMAGTLFPLRFTDGNGGELHLVVAANEAKTMNNANLSLEGSLKLVSSGEGTVVWTAGGVDNVPIWITNGCFRVESAVENLLGGGDLRISGKGQIDLNANPSKYGVASAVAARTVYIEGNGPDGSGAIVNNAPLGGTFGNDLTTMVLTGDATIGGTALLSMIAENFSLTGDYTLTVKNPYPGFTVSAASGSQARLKRIVVDGGSLQFSKYVNIGLTEGIELKNGGTLLTEGGNYGHSASQIPVIRVSEGTGVYRTTVKLGTYWYSGELQVDSGATCNLQGGKTVYLRGRVSGNGAITGINTAWDAGSSWVVTANETGATNRVALAGSPLLTSIKKVEVVFTGDPSFAGVIPLYENCGITPQQVSDIPALVVKTPAGTEIEGASLVGKDGGIFLSMGDLKTAKTALWTNGFGDGDLSNPANWECRNSAGDLLPTALPTNVTVVTLSADAPFNCTNGAPFLAQSVVLPTAMAADCDWRGIQAPFSGRLDLKGRTIKVSQLKGTAEITDSNGEGSYRLLDYIESVGGQYINTTYKHTPTTKVNCVFEITTLNNGWASLFGARSISGGNTSNVMIFYTETNKNAPHCPAYTLRTDQTYLSGWTFSLGKKYDLTCEGRQAAWHEADAPQNAWSVTDTGNPNDGINNMFIFTDNKGDGPDSLLPNVYVKVRLYSFKITEGETVKRDFVPALRMTDGKVGLIDRANGNQFYENQGSGAFLPGPAAGFIDGGTASGEVQLFAAGEVRNEGIALTGSLKLVKEGDGSFFAAKQGQTYTGGTEIRSGTFMCGGYGDKGIYGPNGSVVTVHSNATFNCNWQASHNYKTFILAGGTILCAQNEGGDLAKSWFNQVELTADSAMNCFNSGFIGSGKSGDTRLKLNGHTLQVDGCGGSFALYNDLRIEDEGVCSFAGNGGFRVNGTVSAPKAAFSVVYMTPQMTSGNCLVGSYLGEPGSGSYSDGRGIFTVIDRFKPGLWWMNTILLDGATIDLSEKTESMSTHCSYPKGTKNLALTFPVDGTVKVDLGARKVSSGEKLLTWFEADGQPKTTFVLTGAAAKSHFLVSTETDLIVCERHLRLIIR